VAGNRIELWGPIAGEPELRTTPAGTSVLRFTVDGTGADIGKAGELRLGIVMTGERAQRIGSGLKSGTEVLVKGSLKAVRRRLKSGLFELEYEVIADSIEIGASRH
jgi:primosomal replication protein N